MNRSVADSGRKRTSAQAAGDGKVDFATMQRGRAWTWTYSELQADGSLFGPRRNYKFEFAETTAP